MSKESAREVARLEVTLRIEAAEFTAVDSSGYHWSRNYPSQEGGV